MPKKSPGRKGPENKAKTIGRGRPRLAAETEILRVLVPAGLLGRLDRRAAAAGLTRSEFARRVLEDAAGG